MQAANVKHVTQPGLSKPKLSKQAFKPTIIQKAETVKAQESNVGSEKQPNYSRMFEAYNDCV